MDLHPIRGSDRRSRRKWRIYGKGVGVAKSNKPSESVRKAPGKIARKAVPPAKSVQPKPAAPKPVRRKTTLSKKELAEFRDMLIKKRRTLVGDLSGMQEETAGQQSSGNLSSMPTHMADVGTDNFEHEFTLGLLESEQALLREINEALSRIDDGSYGICLGTGEEIPKQRLKAKPWAKYTVDYARMLEKGLVRAPDAQHGSNEEDTGPEGVEEEVEEEEQEEAGVAGAEEVGEVEAPEEDEE